MLTLLCKKGNSLDYLLVKDFNVKLRANFVIYASNSTKPTVQKLLTLFLFSDNKNNIWRN